MINGFSIIVCTHNPDINIFQNLLSALNRLDEASPEYEIIVVDNNSSPGIIDYEAVQFFFEKK